MMPPDLRHVLERALSSWHPAGLLDSILPLRTADITASRYEVASDSGDFLRSH